MLTAHAANEGIDVEEFARRAGERYSRHFDKKEEYFMPERIEELRAIIAYCQEHKITPVLITTPFSKYYTDLVSQESCRNSGKRSPALHLTQVSFTMTIPSTSGFGKISSISPTPII